MSTDPTHLLAEAAALITKQGVGLGVLPARTRQLALALAWAGLPDTVMTEPQLNVALQAQLDGALGCLSTDHVELRRWLVDAGWLSRDGFGRAYRRVAWTSLGPGLQAPAQPFITIDVAAWAQQVRAATQQRRERQRLSWLEQQPVRLS